MYRLKPYAPVIVLAVFIASCGLPHQHKGASFITAPGLELFGASLAEENGAYVIRSYFQSSIIGRTGYIYENLDMKITSPISAGKSQDVSIPGISIQYASGGQGGQISTGKAKGVITVLQVSDSVVKVQCDLEFSGFTVKGHYGKVPDSVKRKGILTAKKGYRLY